MASSYLELQVGLVKLTWPQGKTEAITAEDKVSTCDFVGANLFKDISISLNGSVVTPSYGNSLYENYIKLRTQVPEVALTKWAQCGFFGDKSQTQADPSAAAGDPGVKARYARYGLGEKNKIYIPILTGIASQLRALPSLLPMKIVFSKGPIGWRVLKPSGAAETYDLRIYDAVLHVRRLVLYPTKLNHLESRIGQSAAKYYFKHSYARSFPIDTGTSSIRVPDILLCNYLPEYLTICFLELRDYKGLDTCSNYAFQSFGLKSLYLKSGEYTCIC